MAIIVSIITPSYNQGQFLEETIKSVICQEGDFYLDYIIMDGGSTDNSVEIIKKYDDLLRRGEWPVHCKGINYRWTSEKDRGQSDAINKGFALAEGEILGWLNSDDVYYPGALQHVSLIGWSGTDFSYGKGMWISYRGQELCLYPTFKPGKYSLYFQCTLCQPTVFFKKSVLGELGEFSLDYYCVFDYEYWMRAIFKGKKFKFIPELLAKSRMYPENKSLSGQETVSLEISQLIQKYYSQEKLNPILKIFYKAFVDRSTDKRIRYLRAKLVEVGNES